jgi:short-subunit dehydrogenase
LLELQEECEGDKGEIRIIAGDLLDSKFRAKLVKKIITRAKHIDYLFNNAGYGTLIHFEHQTLEDIEKMVGLNLIAVEDMARLVLPYMKKAKKGRIINISSVAAFDPPPYLTTYNATKFAVHGFTKSLRYELKKTGVSASVVFPSRMKTAFWNVAFKCYGMNEKEKTECQNKWTKGASTADKVAKRIVRHMNSRRLVILPNLLSKISYHIFSHLRFIGTFYMFNIMEPSSRKKVADRFDLKHKYKANA